MTTRRPEVVIIAAVARNRVLGADQRLPWRLPTDLQRFKAMTIGKPLVIGRKTFESIGNPLPGRESIVVTRDRARAAPGVRFVHGIEEALAVATECAEAMGVHEAIIAGGAQVYAATIGRADRLVLTEVDLTPEGDALFPPIDLALWRETRREQGIRSSRDRADFAFVDYVRREVTALV